MSLESLHLIAGMSNPLSAESSLRSLAAPSAQVLVTFARPEESGAFRRRLAGLKKEKCGSLTVWRGRVASTGVTVMHTGIGPASAARVVREFFAHEKPRRAISAGFAGGLYPALRIGDTLTANFPTPLIFSQATPLETPAQKCAAFRETGARIVDMESDVIAAACAAAGIPLTAVRAVSDTAAEALPVPFAAWFDIARQRARPLALVAHLLRHPSRLAPFARFVLRLPAIAETLAEAITAALRE